MEELKKTEEQFQTESAACKAALANIASQMEAEITASMNHETESDDE